MVPCGLSIDCLAFQGQQEALPVNYFTNSSPCLLSPMEAVVSETVCVLNLTLGKTGLGPHGTSFLSSRGRWFPSCPDGRGHCDISSPFHSGLLSLPWCLLNMTIPIFKILSKYLITFLKKFYLNKCDPLLILSITFVLCSSYPHAFLGKMSLEGIKVVG